jgi:hypothetical protein
MWISSGGLQPALERSVPNCSVSLDRDLGALVLFAGSGGVVNRVLQILFSSHCLGPCLSMIDDRWKVALLKRA